MVLRPTRKKNPRINSTTQLSILIFALIIGTFRASFISEKEKLDDGDGKHRCCFRGTNKELRRHDSLGGFPTDE